MLAIHTVDDTRADLLEVAARVFAEKGLGGARVDEIAERSLTSKQAIYYHFKSKEGLYRAVVSEIYLKLRRAVERFEDHSEGLDPLAAIRGFVAFTYDWHLANEAAARLMTVEDLQGGRRLVGMPNAAAARQTSVALLRRLFGEGVEARLIRQDADPLNFYLSVVGLCFYHLASRHTVELVFGREATDAVWSEHRREQIVETAMRSIGREQVPVGASASAAGD